MQCVAIPRSFPGSSMSAETNKILWSTDEGVIVHHRHLGFLPFPSRHLPFCGCQLRDFFNGKWVCEESDEECMEEKVLVRRSSSNVPNSQMHTSKTGLSRILSRIQPQLRQNAFPQDRRTDTFRLPDSNQLCFWVIVLKRQGFTGLSFWALG
jgi:hypothetical protein